MVSDEELRAAIIEIVEAPETDEPDVAYWELIEKLKALVAK